MKVNVFRYNPESGEEGFTAYELPFGPEEGRTVLYIIKYIQENLDPTLSFFSHCACDRGICGRCLVDVNGAKKLACSCVPDGGEITLRPKNDNYIKDLVCK